MSSDSEDSHLESPIEAKSNRSTEFKKPLLIGKVGQLPRKVKTLKNENHSSVIKFASENKEIELEPESKISHPEDSPSQIVESVPIPYVEPGWGGLPKCSFKDYSFEVLKNGSIIENINLMKRSFWVFGRLAGCDVEMQHPTISRYHAVLQYRHIATEHEEPGFYIYDLGSTHGTFLNKNKLRSRVYIRIQVGHMLKLGCSSRTYILSGPEDDEEAESEFTVTELRLKRAEDIRKRQEAENEAIIRIQKEIEEKKKRDEERGVDWGMGEDADENTDLSENPFAQTNNEELYVDDPKKTLRGFFEREGLNLEYDCSEQGMGQFLCKVELPVDDERGRPIHAEVLHKGKKKEAVIQCALEACRILDRHGILRQAVHESRKRKAKNWADNDFYDSDDDTYLDRTGSIEKKRERRMNAKMPQKAETYESLLERENVMSESIRKIEMQLRDSQCKPNTSSNSSMEDDSLDAYMKELKQSKPDKQTLFRLKTELSMLKKEHANILKLANIAKPASLPPLVARYSSDAFTKSKILPIFGKRKKIKVALPAKTSGPIDVPSVGSEEDEDDDTYEEEKTSKEKGELEGENRVENARFDDCSVSDLGSEKMESQMNSENSSTSTGNFKPPNSEVEISTLKQLQSLLNDQKPPTPEKCRGLVKNILNKLKQLAAEEDRMHWDWKLLLAKRRKVLKLYSDLDNEPDDKLQIRVTTELNNVITELTNMTDQKKKVMGELQKMGSDIREVKDDMLKDLEALQNDIEKYEKQTQLNEPCTSSSDQDNILKTDDTESDLAKRKKKNQRRIQQRQVKADLEKMKGYEKDSLKEDYNMWVPPSNQSGDGKTSLNDKFGY